MTSWVTLPDTTAVNITSTYIYPTVLNHSHSVFHVELERAVHIYDLRKVRRALRRAKRERWAFVPEHESWLRKQCRKHGIPA